MTGTCAGVNLTVCVPVISTKVARFRDVGNLASGHWCQDVIIEKRRQIFASKQLTRAMNATNYAS